MPDIINMALPFFGLIFIGYLTGKIKDIPESGLQWMNFFIIYVALPALFYQLVSKTPFEQLSNVAFVVTATFATFTTLVLGFTVGVLVNGGKIKVATIQSMVSAYANIGYMGPGLTLAVLGAGATVPTALIICFDNAMLFTVAPILIGLAGDEAEAFLATLKTIALRVLLHPFNLAVAAGMVAAYFELKMPQGIDTMLDLLKGAAAPCALFVMGVTVSIRPIRKTPWELAPFLGIKLFVHPIIVYVFLSFVGDFQPVWLYTAVLLAALPPALNVFVMAQQYKTYIERASAAILIGTLLSTITVTGLIYLITTGYLPPDLFPN